MVGDREIQNQNIMFLEDFLKRSITEASTELPQEHEALLKIMFLNHRDIALKGKYERKKFLLQQIENYLTDSEYRTQVDGQQITEPSATGLQLAGETIPQVKLGEIQLSNFRGFQSNDNGAPRCIAFHPKATLFYACNGGGKSSLCEGIEWCLTGTTNESNARGIQNKSEYFQCKYKSTPLFSSSKICKHDTEDAQTEIEKDPSYEKCFLEKNRIERFGRITAQRKPDIKEMLADLFGLQGLAEFVDEFVIADNFSLTPRDLENIEWRRWKTWLNWNDIKNYLDDKIRKCPKNC